jgi:hypothetical protein
MTRISVECNGNEEFARTEDSSNATPRDPASQEALVICFDGQRHSLSNELMVEYLTCVSQITLSPTRPLIYAALATLLRHHHIS